MATISAGNKATQPFMADNLNLLLVGDEDVFEVLRWAGGNFQINFEGKTDPGNDRLEHPRMVDGSECSMSLRVMALARLNPPPLRRLPPRSQPQPQPR